MQHVPCDLCGSSRQRPLHHRGRGKEVVHNVVCKDCGLVFISPRPAADDVTDQYVDGDFSIAARGSHQPSIAKFRASERAALRRYQRLVQVGLHTPGGRYLEVGCGVGSLLRLMRGGGWNVRGLEPDRDFAAAGQTAYGVTIDAALHEDVPYELSAFELIASFHVLEHVLSPTAFLRKINAELADGGHVFIEVPSVERPYGGNLDRFFWAAHLTSFSTNSLGAFLTKAGFDLVWQGFEGDFIQAIARKTEEVSPILPVDSPVKRWAGVKAKGLAYRSLRESAVGPLTRSVKSGGQRAARLLAPSSRGHATDALHHDFERRMLRRAGAPEIVQFCDRVPSPTAIAFRAEVDEAGACVWSTADRNSLTPKLSDNAAVVLGPARWTLEELEYWAAKLAESKPSSVWIPAAEFDEHCMTETARWIDACSSLARTATLGVAVSSAYAQLSDAGVPCVFDPSPLMAAAIAHGESLARSRIIGVCLRLPLGSLENQKLGQLASNLRTIRDHRVRVLLAEPADAEIAPWLHAAGARPEERALHGQPLHGALTEVAGLALLVTNRQDFAEAAGVLGVPALGIDAPTEELRDALTSVPPPARSVAVSTLATVLARSVRSLR